MAPFDAMTKVFAASFYTIAMTVALVTNTEKPAVFHVFRHNRAQRQLLFTSHSLRPQRRWQETQMIKCEYTTLKRS